MNVIALGPHDSSDASDTSFATFIIFLTLLLPMQEKSD